jgi:hypothetical protein
MGLAGRAIRSRAAHGFQAFDREQQKRQGSTTAS